MDDPWAAMRVDDREFLTEICALLGVDMEGCRPFELQCECIDAIEALLDQRAPIT